MDRKLWVYIHKRGMTHVTCELQALHYPHLHYPHLVTQKLCKDIPPYKVAWETCWTCQYSNICCPCQPHRQMPLGRCGGTSKNGPPGLTSSIFTTAGLETCVSPTCHTFVHGGPLAAVRNQAQALFKSHLIYVKNVTRSFCISTVAPKGL